MGSGIVNVGYPPRLNQPGGVAGVGDDGKIPAFVLPPTGGYFEIPQGDILPPSDRQPDSLYGQVLSNYTGFGASTTAAGTGSVQLLGDVPVGTVVKVNINGQLTELLVLHQGNPDPSLYDASCDGTWVIPKDIYSERQWDGSNNDYKNSDVHAWLNNDFLKLFDQDIQAAIKQVKIPYVNGTGDSAVASGANGLSCKIFLLSGYELGWTKNDNIWFPVDGAKLDYFQNGTSSAANQKRIAKYNGSATFWWTRSPNMSSSSYVWYVNSGGSYGSWYYYNTYGVRPAFVLPSTLLVSDDGTVSTNEPPTAPGSIDVSGVVSGGDATITLTAATDPDGSIASYVYERSVDGGDFVQFANVNSLTQTDSIQSSWGTVAYRAAAVDNLGLQGPYITSEAQTVNSGWVLIGGPVSNLGVQGVPFPLSLTVGISGASGITGINLQVLLDGQQLYNNTLNQGQNVTLEIDTRAMGSGQHEIQAIAAKEDYLSANVAWYFVVPSYALPNGGYSAQLEDSSGNPVFPTTTTRDVIGPGGKSAQTQIDELASAHKGITGHLAFVDAVLGPNGSYTLARTADAAYAYQYFAPAAADTSSQALVSVYPAFTGAVGTLLTADAGSLVFNVPENGILAIWQYVVDVTAPAQTDPTVNFTALAQPKVVTAATNTGNTAASLNEALTAMMQAFPAQNYYAIVDAADAGITYYVASQAAITAGTSSATVAYVSSAAPTTWYQGVQMTFVDTSNMPAQFSYLSSPIVTAATSANPVTAGSSLNATLIAMIKAQPTYYRYQLEDGSGDIYYICSPTQITAGSVSAADVLYCTADGTYYNGESLTLAPPPEVTG